ncbi:MAG: RagB/SusD family nutrient uptake outer membrane protein [Gemmatimonadota bacterium]
MIAKTALGLLAILVTTASCSDLLTVDNPTDILDEDLNDTRYVSALANSAEGTLSLIYDDAVRYSELAADGIMHVSNRRENVQLDQGDFEGFNARTEVVWDEVSRSRWTATEVTRRLDELLENPQQDLRAARVRYWDAVARITLADFFKEVPMDAGPPQTPATVYQQAIDLLTAAAGIAQAAQSTEYEAASHGTLARTYRSLYYEQGGTDMGLLASAAQHARQALELDSRFRLDLVYAPPGSQNGLADGLRAIGQYDVMQATWAHTVDPVSGEVEPRIPHGPVELTSAFGDPVYTQMKYANSSSPIPVSRWQEARLIEAEYYWKSGDLGSAVEAINEVRAAVGLPEFQSQEPDEVRQQLIYERAAEFWLEGRRWTDIRYYGIVPSRWSEASKAAGTNRRWAVSLREQGTNPNYQ